MSLLFAKTEVTFPTVENYRLLTSTKQYMYCSMIGRCHVCEQPVANNTAPHATSSVAFLSANIRVFLHKFTILWKVNTYTYLPYRSTPGRPQPADQPPAVFAVLGKLDGFLRALFPSQTLWKQNNQRDEWINSSPVQIDTNLRVLRCTIGEYFGIKKVR